MLRRCSSGYMLFETRVTNYISDKCSICTEESTRAVKKQKIDSRMKKNKFTLFLSTLTCSLAKLILFLQAPLPRPSRCHAPPSSSLFCPLFCRISLSLSLPSIVKCARVCVFKTIFTSAMFSSIFLSFFFSPSIFYS